MHIFRRFRHKLAVLGAVALVAVALAVPALAQDSGATTAPDDTATEETPTDETPGVGRFGEARTAFVEALADELQLPVDQVDEALTAVRERLAEEHQERHLSALQERLDDAVASGDLTQEQADAIADAAAAGVLGRRGGDRPGGFGHHHGPRGWFGGPPDASPGDAGGDGSGGDPA